VGLLASVLLLHYLERLVIPGLLGLEQLATFAVVATLVGSPYRVLHAGIAYALMPRMRAESTVEGRNRLLRSELKLVAALGVGGGAVLAGLALPLIHLLYGDKYRVGFLLVVAIALVGVIRLLYAVASATVGAIGDSQQLRVFNAAGWAGTATAAVGAVLFSVYGLVGVVGGAALGWVLRLAAATVLARRALAMASPGQRGDDPVVRTLHAS
jgi:O-antigen/teichoic acid export membrane protein